ncbi:holin [Lactococcus petauri]|uniref:holin n=1 Tax=Lactococcus petauri TaxID=1940789 RepID=UPI00385464F9
MEYNLLGISALILIILGLTWLKDGEKMDPPLKKRIVIDLVTIALFWGVFEFYKFSGVKEYNNEIALVINGSLMFFFARMIQLICQINPLFQELFAYLKSKVVKIENIDEKKIGDENEKNY